MRPGFSRCGIEERISAAAAMPARGHHLRRRGREGHALLEACILDVNVLGEKAAAVLVQSAPPRTVLHVTSWSDQR